MLCNTCVCEKEVVSAKCQVLIWWQRYDLEVNPTCLHSKLYDSMKHGRITHFQQLSISPSTCCFPMGLFFAHIGFHMFHFSFISYLWDKAFISKTPKIYTLEVTRANFQFFTQVRIFTWFTSDFTAETTSPKDLHNADFMEVSFGCLWGWRSCKAIFWVDTRGMLRSDICKQLAYNKEVG